MSKDVEGLTVAERADRALREAFAKAVEEHRRAGVPLVIWRDDKVIEVSADELSTETDSHPSEHDPLE